MKNEISEKNLWTTKYTDSINRIHFDSEASFRQCAIEKIQSQESFRQTAPDRRFPHRRLSVGLGLAVIALCILFTSGSYTKVSGYIASLVRHYFDRYEANLAPNGENMAVKLHSEYSTVTIEDIVVSNRSIVCKMIGKAVPGTTKSDIFSVDCMALKGTWGDGSTFRYDAPTAYIASEKADEYLVIYSKMNPSKSKENTQIPQPFTAQKATFHFTDHTLDPESAFDPFTIEIKHCYQEKEIAVNQKLHSPGQGSITVKKVTFNGIFWEVLYEMEQNENDSASPFYHIDKNGAGEVYDLTASCDGKEYRSSDSGIFNSSWKETGGDTMVFNQMFGIDEREELQSITLYFKIYETKGLDTKAEYIGKSKEQLEIALTR